MDPIPDGRVLFFMDLRPDHCYVIPDYDDNLNREVVACAIVEVPLLTWTMPLDERFPRGHTPAEMDALVASGAAGEGEMTPHYFVVELEAHGEVVGDWWAADVDDAKQTIEISILGSRLGPVLEELPADRAEALKVIHDRLSDDS